MKKFQVMRVIFSLVFVAVLTVNAAFAIQAGDLMQGIEPAEVKGKALDERFQEAQMYFSLSLFQNVFSERNSGNENVLISPLSVSVALAMTANGASGTTLEEMEALFGGALSVEELNEYMYRYVNNLPSGEKNKLRLANSIWLSARKDFHVKNAFLQKNADYYGADVFQTKFNGSFVNDINRWVSQRTDGKINKILDKANADDVFYLVNALSFDAEWSSIYYDTQIEDGEFTSAGGEKRAVEMMCSREKYVHDELAKGFLKNYDYREYEFVAMLPNEGVDLETYVQSLTAENVLQMIRDRSGEAIVRLPKFRYECSYKLKDSLLHMGMQSAFERGRADFSGMIEYAPDDVFIGNVEHKTFISVNERGTSAGAATFVEGLSGALPEPDPEILWFDRPFVFFIMDTENHLPLFIGAVADIV